MRFKIPKKRLFLVFKQHKKIPSFKNLDANSKTSVYDWLLPEAVVELISEMIASEMTQCAVCCDEIWTYYHPTEEKFLFPQYDDDFWICVDCVQLPQKWRL